MAKETLFPAAYIDRPFQVAVAGSALEADFRNSIEKIYRFYVRLSVHNAAEADRMRKIAGDGATMHGQPANGIGLPVRLTITKTDEVPEATILERDFLRYQLGAWGPEPGEGGGSLDYIVYRTTLKRGTYRVKVIALQDIPEIAGTPTRFVMSAPSFLGG